MEQEHPITHSNKNQKLIASFVVILAVVIVAVGVTIFSHNDKNGSQAPALNPTANKTKNDSSPSNSTPEQTGSTNSTSSKTYKDGEYAATGTYTSPGGQESVTVHVTVKDNVVTDTSLDQHANNPDTQEYQADFASGYKQLVVGKPLDSIRLSHVSGSSLTSQGFNAALDRIKDQAS